MKLLFSTLASILIATSVSAEKREHEHYKHEKAPDYYPYTNRYLNSTRSDYQRYDRRIDYFPYTNRDLYRERVIVETEKGATNIIVITKE